MDFDKMLKAKVSDILIVGVISGIVAILTSIMGIAGTIIGSVVSSIAIQIMTTLFRDPLKDKMEEMEKYEEVNGYGSYNRDMNHLNRQEYIQKDVTSNQDSSFITTKVLFLFPLIVILVIEIVHFLGLVQIIPIDIFYNLEAVTNWTLFKTIGYALIIMGIYPFISKKLGMQHGFILIAVGIIELIFGYADSNVHVAIIYQTIASLKEFINIAVILAILYTVLTVPNDIDENTTSSNIYKPTQPKKFNNNRNQFNKPNQRLNKHNFNNDNYNNNYYDDNYDNNYDNRQKHSNRQKYNNKRKQNKKNKEEFNDDDYYYYY